MDKEKLNSKFNGIISYNKPSLNPFILSLLDDSFSIEDAAIVYNKYVQEYLPKGIELGRHPSSNKEMLYLFKENKIVYEDTNETIPYESMPDGNRFIHARGEKNVITEAFLLESRKKVYEDNKKTLNTLVSLKSSFFNSKIKIIDDTVYTDNVLVYVFLTIYKTKLKKFDIPLNKNKYTQSEMMYLFSVLNNNGFIGEYKAFANFTSNLIKVKRNKLGTKFNFLHKKCILMD